MMRLTPVFSFCLALALCACVPAGPDAANPAVIIAMDETGFAPNVVSIELGQTVCWKNTGSTSHWPASNIHPTHDIYPEFDPKKGITAGEQWCFAFDRPGIWRFHDHLEAQFSGVVNVSK